MKMPRADEIRLAVGGMTAGEMRAVKASLEWFIKTRCAEGEQTATEMVAATPSAAWPDMPTETTPHCSATAREWESIADMIPKWFEGGARKRMLEEAFAQIRKLEAALRADGGGSKDALKPPHKCEMIARCPDMEDGREWWMGKLLKPIPEWPRETHCLHMKTPLKDVVFLCNLGDFLALATFAQIRNGQQINPSWLDAMVRRYTNAADPSPDSQEER